MSPFSVGIMLRSQVVAKTMSRGMAQVKAPIKLYSTEGRYATALYTVAAGQQQLPEADKDMQAIKKLLDTNKDFKSVTVYLIENLLNIIFCQF